MLGKVIFSFKDANYSQSLFHTCTHTKSLDWFQVVAEVFLLGILFGKVIIATCLPFLRVFRDTACAE